MCAPLIQFSELHILPYDPLICSKCAAVLNPYARVDYTYRIWFCSFCFFKNPFPRTYSSSLEESNLPAELFPNYSSVEYGKSVNPIPKPLDSMITTTPKSITGDFGVRGPAFVFVIDGCMEEDELRGVKSELLRVVESLPENALVGLVTFDGMVNVYDLGFLECSRGVVFHDTEVSRNRGNKAAAIRKESCYTKLEFSATYIRM